MWMLLNFSNMDRDRAKFERFFIADVDEFAFLLYAAVNAQLVLWGCHLEWLYHFPNHGEAIGDVVELSMEVVSELTFYCCCNY